MLIREYAESDLEVLKKIHVRQGFDYVFPNVASPLFVSKIVLEDSSVPVMASFARVTCEIYLLADPLAGKARDRYASMLTLHRAAADDLRARGFEDAHAWLPPRIARRFGKRLEHLGWVRDDRWTPYSRLL
jgi:hypothetical protein